MNDKLKIFGGLGVLIFAVAVLGAVVWRTGNLQNVFQKPKAAGNDCLGSVDGNNHKPGNDEQNISLSPVFSWNYSQTPTGISPFVMLALWTCNPDRPAGPCNGASYGGPDSVGLPTSVPFSSFTGRLTSLTVNTDYWIQVASGATCAGVRSRGDFTTWHFKTGNGGGGGGTVQGCKVLGTSGDCYAAANSAFNSKLITLDGAKEANLGNSAANSYAFSNVSSGSHTVAVPSAPSGYTVSGYSLCTNTTGCHTALTGTSNLVSVNVPSGGYADLWWHFSQTGEGTVPNCTNLTGPTSLTVGQAGTYTADHSSPQGSLRGTIDVGQNGQILASSMPGITPSGNSGSSSFTWTPTTAGTYDILCRSWNDGVAECRGKANYVDAPPRYACAGPNSSLTVTVVAVTQAKYKCSGTSCVRDDANGTYTDSNCNSACVGTPGATATLSLNPASLATAVNTGDAFSVDVALDSGGTAVSGVTAILTYDKDKLDVVDDDTAVSGIQITPGSAFNQGIVNDVDPATGKISYHAGALGSTFNGANGQVATIHFKAKAEGNAAVSFDTTASLVAAASEPFNILKTVTNGAYLIGISEADSCWGDEGKRTTSGRCYDCNGDGGINILDFSCFAQNWQQYSN